jgi:hypothetical protein
VLLERRRRHPLVELQGLRVGAIRLRDRTSAEWSGSGRFHCL